MMPSLQMMDLGSSQHPVIALSRSDAPSCIVTSEQRLKHFYILFLDYCCPECIISIAKFHAGLGFEDDGLSADV